MTEPALEMAEQTAPRIPDGSRPLIVDRPTVELQVVKARVSRICYEALRLDAPPKTCRRSIKPGEFYLLHRQVSPSGVKSGRYFMYCAPCAVREWGARGVHEQAAT